MRDIRDLLQVQFVRLAQQQLAEPPIFAQDKRVIEAGNEEDFLHAKRHEVIETFEPLFRVRDRFRCLP